MKRTVFTAAVALIFSALAQAQTPSGPTGSILTPAQPPSQPVQQPAAGRGNGRAQQDFPNLARYRDANRNLPAPSASEARVVFMGDSITELWDRDPGKFFASKGYIGRGIGGQTTPQMLIRFQQDVVALKPKVVALNSWMKGYCARTGCVYADYFTPLSDEKHGMKEGLSRDGIHPTPAGYAIMAPIAERAIAQALGKE
jgi:hypothetical protein